MRSCDHGTINLILEYLTGNGYYIVLLTYKILTRNGYTRPVGVRVSDEY